MVVAEKAAEAEVEAEVEVVEVEVVRVAHLDISNLENNYWEFQSHYKFRLHNMVQVEVALAEVTVLGILHNQSRKKNKSHLDRKLYHHNRVQKQHKKPN